MSPPNRLAPGARWRSFKRGPDALVWESATERLRDLRSDGWRVSAVTVEWRKARPMLPREIAEGWIREMIGAEPSVPVTQEWGTTKRGACVVELVR